MILWQIIIKRLYILKSILLLLYFARRGVAWAYSSSSGGGGGFSCSNNVFYSVIFWVIYDIHSFFIGH